ncbi:MAG: methyltransferase domain-containing protein [Gemmataceae bacterium]
MSATFIVGSARSGTTSLLKVLGLSKQAHCLVEPMPNLTMESREMLERRLSDPYEVLTRHIAPRVGKGLSKRPHYIEKQISLLPFMKHLDQLFHCRFIIPIRDGREVVTSLINWHNQMFPCIYQECRERGDLSLRAEAVLARQVGPDPFDYSLPRPGREDPWHKEWRSLSRFDMASWYWSYINRLAVTLAKEIDPARVLIVDYTQPTTETIKRIYDFVGLTDFDESSVASLLQRRINSLEDRIDESGAFPSWRDWTPHQAQRFSEIAYGTMRLLGYESSPVRPKPPGFGEWWIEKELDEQWYQEIYQYRAPLHDLFQNWFRAMNQGPVGPIESIIEIGCGTGHGYTSFFHDKDYLGIDLSPRLVNFCNDSNRNPNHSFFCCDVLESIPQIVADLTFSQGTIDNVYDLDAFLRAMAHMTRKVLYVINYRGYFQDLADHRYRWDPQTRVCFNDLSARRAADVLRQEGFQTVLVFPQATQRADIPVETVILASRERVAPEVLMAHHDVHSAFSGYEVRSSEWKCADVLNMVNTGCAYFSESGLDLANDLGYFRSILASIAELKTIRPGTVAQLADGASSVNLAIRTDVDMDLPAALRMAQIAGQQQFPISMYLLHTAAYYGYFADGIFHRHEHNGALYRQLQDDGAEIGLHIDPYAIYLEQGVDGAQAIKTELAWLRSLGLNISGTSAHNAAPVYGAENFEIFKGRSIRRGDWFNRHFVYLPLGILDEAELGLDYDAACPGPANPGQPVNDADPYLTHLPDGDFLRQYEWLRSYLVDNCYCRWGHTYNIWLLGKDMWAIAGHPANGETVFHFDVPWSMVNEFLAGIGAEEKVLITLHPIYLGKRLQVGAAPEESIALKIAA